MIDVIVGMAVDIAMLKTAFGNSLKVGPVAQVDAQKGYRIRLGGGEEKPVLSNWYPHPETGKTSVPLKVNQIVGMLNPTGDPRKGLLIRGGYSNENSSPNADMDANVFKDAGVEVTIAGGALVISAGGTTVRISGSGLDVDGGHIKNDGVAVDKTHRHTEVVHGGDTSGVPVGG
ncbi:MAG TPA: baseplate assembly protein [Shinella sp.]|jgi:phage baseplate assembly protein gpV|uniref:baseplate assembly protein n=1 Tax=Shinella sp. TaxID=1870904 RepID=UPI002E14B8AF|nr:baseplate assembly protein [Shinella sp.]